MAGQAIWQVLVLLLFASAVVQGVVLVAVMRQVGGVLVQITPPRPGELEGGPAVGTMLDLPGAVPDKPAIVVFAAPNCAPCQELMPSVPVAARHYREIQFMAVITGRELDERTSYAATIEGVTARADLHHLHDEWQIPGTPYAVGLDEDGRVVRTGVVNHLDHLESLADSVLHRDTGLSEADASANGHASSNGHGSRELAATSSSNGTEGVDV
jgi:thiol-disulfide isomerase/thioredoxin